VAWEGGDGSSSASTGDACYSISNENMARPNDVYFDFDKDPSQSSSDSSYPESSSDYATGMRMLDKFFNQHFQLYHRHVHMRLWHAHTARGGGAPAACPTAADREADAAEQIQGFDPFAVLDYSASNEQAYDQYMNKHGVVSFITQSPLAGGSLVGRPA